MHLVPSKTELRFMLQWIFATLSGFLLSLFLIEVGEKPDVGVLDAAIGGSAIAFSQSLILRQPIISLKWVLSTLLGWTLVTATGVGAVGWIVPTTQMLPLRILNGIIYGAIGGFGIGFAQWLAIYETVPLAWRWILISAASWAMAIPIGSAFGWILRQFTQVFWSEILGLAITWLLVAVLTGINAYKLLVK
ncbi:MAG: hypothetical protein KME23_13355 [Goleter apudmare HA4340-LM2]|jgi:hypothetical protein|nr:hypothetical protein [Goleter apudmare HA4340-LM2]